MFDPRTSNAEVATCVRDLIDGDADPYYTQALLAIANTNVSVDDTCVCISAVGSQEQRDLILTIARDLHAKLCALMERIQ